MRKGTVISRFKSNPDQVLSLKGKEAILATTDFRTKYIRRFRRPMIPKTGDILVFDYSHNRFEKINANNITNMNPLAQVLNNAR